MMVKNEINLQFQTHNTEGINMQQIYTDNQHIELWQNKAASYKKEKSYSDECVIDLCGVDYSNSKWEM